MKNKMCKVLISILAAGIIYGCAAGEKKESKVEQKPLVIEIKEPCRTGTLVVYADGATSLEYSGRIEIANDGKIGEEIEIFVYAEEVGTIE